MVNFICPKCNKVYDRKFNLEKHLNRKFSCVQNIYKLVEPQQILVEPQNLLKNNSKNTQNNVIFDEKIENNENLQNNNLFCCNFCKNNFNRNDNLKRHLKICKEKKKQDEEKENIFKLLLERDEQMKKMEEEKQKILIKMEEDNKILLNKFLEDNKKRDEEKKDLENYIKKITDLNLDLNNQVKKLMEKLSITNSNITNNNTINNTINNINISSDKLVDFGKEDMKEIEFELFNKIYDKIGKHIFTTSAGNIWNNKPKYKNVYVSDLSREKAMTVKNGKFELTPLNTVLTTINQQLYKYFNYNLEQLEKKGDKVKLKKFEDSIEKSYRMFFKAFDDAKNRFIPGDDRLKEFDDVVNKELVQFFYNLKEDVKNNYNKILDDIKKDNILKKINYEPPKKSRGRPRKIPLELTNTNNPTTTPQTPVQTQVENPVQIPVQNPNPTDTDKTCKSSKPSKIKVNPTNKSEPNIFVKDEEVKKPKNKNYFTLNGIEYSDDSEFPEIMYNGKNKQILLVD